MHVTVQGIERMGFEVKAFNKASSGRDFTTVTLSVWNDSSQNPDELVLFLDRSNDIEMIDKMIEDLQKSKSRLELLRTT